MMMTLDLILDNHRAINLKYKMNKDCILNLGDDYVVMFTAKELGLLY